MAILNYLMHRGKTHENRSTNSAILIVPHVFLIALKVFILLLYAKSLKHVLNTLQIVL